MLQQEPRDTTDPCTEPPVCSPLGAQVGSERPGQLRGPRAKTPGPMLGCRPFIPSNLNASRLISFHIHVHGRIHLSHSLLLLHRGPRSRRNAQRIVHE